MLGKLRLVVEKAHDEYEDRKVRALPTGLLDDQELTRGEGLRLGIVIEAISTTTCIKIGAVSTNRRCFISSLVLDASRRSEIAKDAVKIIRSH